MPIMNSLVVPVAVLRLAGYAFQAPDAPTPVHIVPVASIQVLAASPAETGRARTVLTATEMSMISATAGVPGRSGRILSSLLPSFLQTPDVPLPAVVTPTPTPTPTPGPALFAIEYRITGTATHCSATYENDKGGTNQIGVNLPFTYNWNGAKSGDFVYVSCQIDTATDHGDLSVAIYKNGVLYKSSTATAFPSSATASGSY